MRLALVCAVAFGALLTFGAAPALAHATVTGSDPVDGSDLARSPSRVSVTFDEAVGLEPGYLRVIDASGRRVDTGPAFHPDGRGDTVAVALRPNLPRAGYLASYRVVSADSHPVGGVVRFSIGGAAQAPVTAAPSAGTDGGVSMLLNIARSFSFVGLAVAGGWWLMFWLAGREPLGGSADDQPERAWLPRSRALIAAGLGSALFGVVVELIGQGPYVSGASLGALGRSELLADTLASPFGRWHLAELVLLAVLLLAVLAGVVEDASRYRRTGWAVGAVLWAAVLACVAATGHAAARSPVWLGELSIWLHLAAVTTWIGGLAVLAVAVLARREGDTTPALALPVFSQVALACVAVIAATGTYQAYRELGAWSELIDTEYGLLVLAKIGLFCVLIGLGAVARRTLRHDDGAGAPVDQSRLRLGVVVELALAVAVLVVSAVLVAQPPGHAASATVPAVADTATVALSTDRELTVEVDPARAGRVVVTLSVTPGDAVQSMTVTATLPSESIGPIPVPVTAVDDLAFRSGPVDLPAAGTWQFAVAVQTSEFDVTTATVPIVLS